MAHYPLISAREMQDWELQAFAAGVSDQTLLLEAAQGLADAIRERHSLPGRLQVWAGSGHNAADALLAARLLVEEGWKVSVEQASAPERWKPLRRHHWELLEATGKLEETFPEGPTVILDGLLGLGATGEIRSKIQEYVLEINRLRLEYGADVIAVDVPTGVDADTGKVASGAVLADATVTFGLPKRGLVKDEALGNVGRLYVVPLPSLPFIKDPEPPLASRPALVSEPQVRQLLRLGMGKRTFDFHKGQAGRVGLVAGSPGMLGAAHLAALGAQAAGVGLITVYVADQIQLTAMAALPPEIMVRTWHDVGPGRADAWGVGPGLGLIPAPALVNWMQSTPEPMVWDADALNWMAAKSLQSEDFTAGPRLLTPHPGEFRRLFPMFKDLERQISAERVVKTWPVTLLAKSSRSVAAEGGRPVVFNATGTPVMASGGMGDVLTGFLTGLLAQGLSPFDAAVAGSWCLGRAGEIAAGGARGLRSVTASEVAAALRQVACS